MTGQDQSLISQKRRRLIAALGATGVAGISGCLGDDEGEDVGALDEEANDEEGNGDETGEDDSDTGNESSNETEENNDVGDSGTVDRDNLWLGYELTNPNDAQFNLYNPTGAAGEANAMLWDTLASYNEETNEWVSFIADDWSFEGDEGTITLNDFYTWSNGDPVTANDVVTQLRIDEHFETGAWDFLANVEAADDYEVALEFQGEVNPAIVEDSLMGTQVYASESVYGEYLARFEDEEPDAVLEDLIGWDPEEPELTNGPFEFHSRSETRLILEKYDDYESPHFSNEDLNYDYWGYEFGDAQLQQTLIVENESDGGLATLPGELYEELDDYWEEVDPSNFNGLSLTFNHDHEFFSIREVRQAFGHLIPRQMTVELNQMGYLKTPHEHVVGIDPAVVDEWLSDDFTDNLTEYAWDGQNPDEARALLEEAGFEDDGGTWLDPNGETFQPEITVRTGAAEWVAAVELWVDLLRDFGIEAEMLTIDDTQAQTSWADGDFELMGQWWAGGWPSAGHPYISWRDFESFGDSMTAASLDNEVEVPMPVGDPEGDLETIDILELLNELVSTVEEERSTEIVEQLAWIYNQYLPRYAVQTHHQTRYYRTDRWDTAHEDEEMHGLEPDLEWPRMGGMLRSN